MLLLDFDGTICLGDEPVLAYADAAARGLAPADAQRIRSTVQEFVDGKLGGRWPDGYLAVQDLTREQLDETALNTAYAASRKRLQAGELAVYAPDGLADFLNGLDGVAERVLVTNAPAEGVTEVLLQLGVTSLLDRVVSSAAKPDGWDALLPQILGDRPASAAVSVGDVYRNDIAPLIAHGAATAFIDRFGVADLPASPTWTARSFPDLYSTLAEWLDSAHPEGN
ncbi:HAD family hydrolase [Flexivirga caeni]|uniref:HAD family hydrolase n=1 Tax=Flexivirga caeni TaxID=2294115 RepID=A0A3M9LYR2_9MICO|nr:HAD family hydrolase [Flexivirga caeni]